MAANTEQPLTSTARTCEACGATEIHSYPRSRRSGRVIVRCRECGLRFLSNPDDASTIGEFYDEYDREIFAVWLQAKRSSMIDKTWRSTMDRITNLVGGTAGRTLFDVGSGDGAFLELARSRGYEVAGNELAPGAVELARETFGIDLHLGDLSSIEGADLADAVTMWCVLAHVPDPDALLSDCLRILKPGGVLFMQTPRWSFMDSAALTASKATGGRMSRIIDRRLSDTHMRLHSKASMRQSLKRLGFEVIGVESRVRYTLETTHYLHSLGVPERLRRPLSSSLDQFVERDLFFRNVLDVFARKPPS